MVSEHTIRFYKKGNDYIMQEKFIKDINILEGYNSKRILRDEMPEVRGIPHVFFTTPMLNIQADNCMQDSFMAYMYRMRANLLSTLSYGNTGTNGYLGTTSPFIKLLYNSATNFDVKDSVAKTKEVGETFYGYKEYLPSSNVDSIAGDEFTVNFLDWQDLPVLNVINAWYTYVTKVRRGELYPNNNAIKNNYLDYVSSVYYFVTSMDGSTLQYWCKLTGVAPISVPYSSFSSDYATHDVLKYPVNFLYSFKEDMNPDILLDFNKTSLGINQLINYGTYQDSITSVGNASAFPSGFLREANEYDSTEYEKNGYNHPYIGYMAYTHCDGTTNENGYGNQKPTFKLLFENR